MQCFASTAARHEAQLLRGAGADLTVPERLRKLRQLNGRIFAPFYAALKGHSVTVELFKRQPQESDDNFMRSMAKEKDQWTYSVRKLPR